MRRRRNDPLQIGTRQIFELWYGKADYRMRELFLGYGLNGYRIRDWIHIIIDGENEGERGGGANKVSGLVAWHLALENAKNF